MTFGRVVKLTQVKARRADQRMADVQRCRRQLADAQKTLSDAQTEAENFKQNRKETVKLAYAAVRGQELSEPDLRNLNQKLDKLMVQERDIIANLDVFRQAISEAEAELSQALIRFQQARRNHEKWESMLVPMRKSIKREAERKAEIERDDQSVSLQRFQQ